MRSGVDPPRIVPRNRTRDRRVERPVGHRDVGGDESLSSVDRRLPVCSPCLATGWVVPLARPRAPEAA
jgi:hypothetical protein